MKTSGDPVTSYSAGMEEINTLSNVPVSAGRMPTGLHRNMVVVRGRGKINQYIITGYKNNTEFILISLVQKISNHK